MLTSQPARVAPFADFNCALPEEEEDGLGDVIGKAGGLTARGGVNEAKVALHDQAEGFRALVACEGEE